MKKKNRHAFVFHLDAHAGFCWGVKRAIDGVRGAQGKSAGWKSGGNVVVLGPLVNNPKVRDELAEAGVQTVDRNADIRGGTVVITAHGRDPEEIADVSRKSDRTIDMTCPIVKNLHLNASTLKAEGRKIVLIGIKSRFHPEIAGVVGLLNGEVFIVETAKDAKNLPYDPADPIGVVAQTTFDEAKISHFVELIRKRFSDVKVLNTLCDDIKQKQDSMRTHAPRYDLVIVVGDPTSANTSHLAEISKNELKKPTRFVPGAEKIFPQSVRGYKKIYVTAGASTPPSAIEGVIAKLQSFGGKPESPTAQRS
ncbi:MAG: 4-hydroxy-3-methylbut-2-enyl diphosphate reductase [bacterium]|nr:4-hydroxy-3-methylbut-2-enyl diphosphate reductase [bacterium]